MMSSDIWQEYQGPFTLEEFVQVANRLLPRYLPEEVEDARVRGAVNPRLVRHLTTLGVLDDALREGREARYTLRHLLQLLAARRLMAEGYTTGSVKKLIAAATDSELEMLLQNGVQLTVEASRPVPAPGYAAPAAPSYPTLAPDSAPGNMETAEASRAGQAKSGSDEGKESALAFLRNIRTRSSENRKGGASTPTVPINTPEPSASRWERLEIMPGLEVHVREDFTLPPTPHERDTLLQYIWNQLKRSRGKTGHSSGQRRAKP